MSEHKPSNNPVNSVVSFFALYVTTLFSLDTWAAARASPYRAPGTNTYFRPANTPPSPDSYQGGMHGRGNAGRGSGGGSRGTGRVSHALDTRPPLRVGGTASCGACMT